MPMSRRLAGRWSMARPSTRTLPALGTMKPPMTRSNVVLPQPLGPRSATSSPASMASCTSSTAMVAPKRCVIDSSSTLWPTAVGSITRVVPVDGHLSTWRGRGSMPAIRSEGVARMADWKPPTQDRVEGYFKELNNWGRWGNDDQKGTVNLITAAKRQAAIGLVKTGRTVSLARDVVPMPVVMSHAAFPSERERADVVLDRFDMVYHGYWITHIDALCHVGWDREIYNC